ncbi:hypothetical protein K7H91_21015 [Martelella mediterranea]|uniref:hypothetical protein n=1 Tax=Martelella mediterranea TaxID=293089 RepID=UPI001E33F09C|nr:hypothetical protein [Martelella mediterranea]MCD1636246.1 hypothetical protein [Martelella mediterranea]
MRHEENRDVVMMIARPVALVEQCQFGLAKGILSHSLLDEWPEDTDLPLTLQEQKPHFYR